MPTAWKRALGQRVLYRPWVAEIAGQDTKYGLTRRFLKGKLANGPEFLDDRVYSVYTIEAGHIYEVNAPLDWNRADRYYCTVTERGQVERLTGKEVEAWTRANEAPRHTSERTS